MRKGGRSHEQQAALERYYAGLPVRDAVDDYRIIPNEDDLKCAIREDPQNCVLANAAKRRDGATAVLIFLVYAYVDLMQPDGTRIVERFKVSPATRRAIERYDLTGEMPPGGFVFKAPSKADSLEERRASRARSRQRQREALLRGETINRGKSPTFRKPVSLGIRDGTGLVTFQTKRGR